MFILFSENKNKMDCHVCDKSVKKNAVKEHIHQHKLKSVKPFQCCTCSRRFPLKSELKTHVKVEHENHRWKCSKCGKNFKSNNGLKYHERGVHKIGELHVCIVCQEKFPTKQKLLIHKRKEHSLEQLICNYCKGAFVYPWKFKKHMLSCKAKPGGEERNRKCSNCFKRYKTISYLRQHRKRCIK